MRLKEIRTARGLGQKDVASVIGCSVTVYSRYETGDREPGIDTLIRLADFYNISLDELVGRTPMQIEVIHGDPPPLADDEWEIQIDPEQVGDGLPDYLEEQIAQIVQKELKKRGL